MTDVSPACQALIDEKQAELDALLLTIPVKEHDVEVIEAAQTVIEALLSLAKGQLDDCNQQIEQLAEEIEELHSTNCGEEEA